MSKLKASRQASNEVDAYLADLPDDVRDELERVRAIVRETVPACTERVSYGIPIFRLRRDLVGMSAAKNHCSLHTMSPPLAKAMAVELKGFQVSGATIHFGPENPLPRDLVERIVRRRLEELDPG